jgi:hypothetical protein
MESENHVDVSAPEAKAKGGRARRPRGAKPPTDTGAKRSLNLRVDDETYERLTIHAMRRRTTISALVMDLSREHLREFSIHRIGDRSARAEQGD